MATKVASPAHGLSDAFGILDKVSSTSSSSKYSTPCVNEPRLSSQSSSIDGLEPRDDINVTKFEGPTSKDLEEKYIPVGAVCLNDAIENGIFNSETYTWRSLKERSSPRTELNELAGAGWIKTKSCRNNISPAWYSVRVYVLPEDLGRRYNSSEMTSSLRRALRIVMSHIDVSLAAWEGRSDPSVKSVGLLDHGNEEEESLFYIFNTLKSPSPETERVSNVYAQQAITDIMDGEIDGLITKLYPYQQRSAALMIERETTPPRMLDPRFKSYHDQNGVMYYYNREEGVIVREKIEYEQSCGGILAETMGHGKTLICLAVILATRGHVSRVPDGGLLMAPEPSRRTPSLMEMAARKASEASVPWKSFFQAQTLNGYHFEKCEKLLQANVGRYQVAEYNVRTSNRNPGKRADRIVRLCSTTLIIVPQNLLVQWQNEILKHVRAGILSVLVIDQPSQTIPSAEELRRYDVVLMSKSRFEKEGRDADVLFGIATIQSPLMEMLWVRVVVDEGHGFAGAGQRTNAMAMLDRMHIERRWVVSGTPSGSLIGVDVGLAANETPEEDEKAFVSAHNDTISALKARKHRDTFSEEMKDLDKLKLMVVNFLKLRPWANPAGDDRADWSKYMKPVDLNGVRRKSTYLRSLLQSLIIRHTIEDINIDLLLPRLHNKVVYLQPSFYDKLSINLFLAVLASNAVTSERVDEDYMFHSKNRRQLDVLVGNLRQSGFWWVGFKKSDILETVRVSKKYMEENADKETFRDSDRVLMLEAITAAEQALTDPGWQAFSTLHEVGVYVQDFPDSGEGDVLGSWALDGRPSNPVLLGTVQARMSQQYIEAHSEEPDPTEGLAGAGLRAMQQARSRAAQEDETVAKSKAETGLIEEPKLSSPKKSLVTTKSPRKQSSTLSCGSVPSSKILGFSSAKLTYLVDRVLELQDSEKIIIFYEGNNVAFWIAEALELVHVKFLIYSNTLTVSRRATYLATFNQKEDFRILLMDLKQAAHGLHVACASRVFIVNPIWQPSIESQAIKRAHRIGQVRPVYVETLVLRDTLEDKMLRRRKEMSDRELQNAEKSLVDDITMKEMIQHETFIPVGPDEGRLTPLSRSLNIPQLLFGRRTNSVTNAEEELVGVGTPTNPAMVKRKAGKTHGDQPTVVVTGHNSKRPKVSFQDATSPDSSLPRLPYSKPPTYGTNGEVSLQSFPTISTPSVVISNDSEHDQNPDLRMRLGFVTNTLESPQATQSTGRSQITPRTSIFGGPSV